jgi:hypothetical protein
MRDLGGGVKEHFAPATRVERGAPAVDPLAPLPQPAPQRVRPGRLFTANGHPDSWAYTWRRSVTAQVPARAQHLYAVWQKLPAEPMAQPEFDQSILRAMGRSGPGHEANVDALRFLLTSSDAVKVRRFEDGVLRYKRSDRFPEHPPTGPGTAAWDQQNREQAAREREDADRASAAVERNAPQLRQRQEWDQHFRALALEVFRAEMPQMLRQHDREVEQQRAEGRSRRRQQVEDGWRAATAQNGDAVDRDAQTGR